MAISERRNPLTFIILGGSSAGISLQMSRVLSISKVHKFSSRFLCILTIDKNPIICYTIDTIKSRRYTIMDFGLFGLFVALTIVNVILQTTRSLCTVKSGKVTASLVNALCYGVYTVVIVYTMCDLSLAVKVAVTAVCNFIGVFVVKLVEEKLRKDRLWKIEGTVVDSFAHAIHVDLEEKGIPHNYIMAGPWAIFNCYCATQKDSVIAKEVLDLYDAKYFVTESEVL